GASASAFLKVSIAREYSPSCASCSPRAVNVSASSACATDANSTTSTRGRTGYIISALEHFEARAHPPSGARRPVVKAGEQCAIRGQRVVIARDEQHVRERDRDRHVEVRLEVRAHGIGELLQLGELLVASVELSEHVECGRAILRDHLGRLYRQDV